MVQDIPNVRVEIVPAKYETQTEEHGSPLKLTRRAEIDSSPSPQCRKSLPGKSRLNCALNIALSATLATSASLGAFGAIRIGNR